MVVACTMVKGHSKLPDFIVADQFNLTAVEGTALRQKAEPLTFPLSEEDKKDIELLLAKFNDQNAITGSLAAPQIGVAKRIIIIAVPKKIARREKCEELSKTTVFINPQYEKVSDEILEAFETCFSVKNTVGKVPRYKSIRYKGWDREGQPLEGEVSGTAARFFQHEVDHLDGRIFLDIVTKEKLVTESQYMEDLMKNVVMPAHADILQI